MCNPLRSIDLRSIALTGRLDLGGGEVALIEREASSSRWTAHVVRGSVLELDGACQGNGGRPDPDSLPTAGDDWKKLAEQLGLRV